jgi:hypothetical protein
VYWACVKRACQFQVSISIDRLTCSVNQGCSRVEWLICYVMRCGTLGSLPYGLPYGLLWLALRRAAVLKHQLGHHSGRFFVGQVAQAGQTVQVSGRWLICP